MMRRLLGVVVVCGLAFAQEGGRAQAAAFIPLLGDPQLGPVAERSLARMGPTAIPALAAGLAEVSLTDAERSACARLLGKIGTKSDAAKRALAKSMRDRTPAVRVAAALALLQMDDRSEAVITALASSLAAGNDQTRRAAAVGLSKAGKDAKSAIPALMRALGDQNPEVRRQAGAALSSMGVAAVDALGKGTTSDDPVQRASAALVLGDVGRDASGAVPPLTKLLDDDLDRVRIEAAAALGRIGPGASGATNKLRENLVAPRSSAELRAVSLRALDAIRPQGWDAVKELRKLWTSDDPQVRAFAASELGRRKVEDAMPDLVVGLNDMSHLVREQSALALARIDPKSDEVLMVLTAGLQDRFLLSRAAAARALGEMGGDAAPARALLEQAAADAEETLATAASEALKRIG